MDENLIQIRENRKFNPFVQIGRCEYHKVIDTALLKSVFENRKE